MTQKIVLIDDDNITIEILKSALSDYEVHSFTDPNLGLNYVLDNSPDIVLLDINMPERNGLEICEEIRSHPNMAYTNILFITSLSSQIDEEKGLKAGAVDYINKPLCLPVIKNRIEIHLKLNLHRKLLSKLIKHQKDKLERTEEEFIRLFLKQESKLNGFLNN